MRFRNIEVCKKPRFVVMKFHKYAGEVFSAFYSKPCFSSHESFELILNCKLLISN